MSRKISKHAQAEAPPRKGMDDQVVLQMRRLHPSAFDSIRLFKKALVRKSAEDLNEDAPGKLMH